jgi:hypothetical protein
VLSGARIYLENLNGCLFDFRFCNHPVHLFIMIDRRGVSVVESGCKRIYNDQNEYFLDLRPVDYDIINFVRVWLFSTHKFWIDLTCQSSYMISVILSGLGVHLRICNPGILNVFSIYVQSADIWFLTGDICKIHILIQPQHIGYPLI